MVATFEAAPLTTVTVLPRPPSPPEPPRLAPTVPVEALRPRVIAKPPLPPPPPMLWAAMPLELAPPVVMSAKLVTDTRAPASLPAPPLPPMAIGTAGPSLIEPVRLKPPSPPPPPMLCARMPSELAPVVEMTTRPEAEPSATVTLSAMAPPAPARRR